MNHIASAPAKIILLGEHAVVYGQPALAVPLSALRTYAKVNLSSNGLGLTIIASDLHNQQFLIDLSSRESNNPLVVSTWLLLDYLNCPPPDATIILHSDIPIASGMGSGASITASLFRALLSLLNKSLSDDQLNDLVYQAEKIHHGTPSGIDNTVIIFEQPIYFVRSNPIERFVIGQPFTLLVGNTGVESSTKIAVGDVRALYESNIDLITSTFSAIGDLVRDGRRAIEVGDQVSLGKIMNENHKILCELTVSSPALDTLVDAARKAGALGAKLSGAGRGGNMIALVAEEKALKVRNALLEAGAVQVYQTVVGK